MVTMPEFQYQEGPENIAVVWGLVVIHGRKSLFDKVALEITALVGPRIVQNFLGHAAHFCIGLQPHAHRQSKAMFLLFKNCFRKQLASGLLEQKTLLESLNF